MQYFAQSPHEPVLAAALATAEDHGITAEHAAVHLKAGVARYWQQAQRAGRAGSPESGAPPTAEEAERLRQLEMVRAQPARCRAECVGEDRERSVTGNRMI